MMMTDCNVVRYLYELCVSMILYTFRFIWGSSLHVCQNFSQIRSTISGFRIGRKCNLDNKICNIIYSSKIDIMK